MFKTKSEVDRHVYNCLQKINSDTERNLRSFSFAKLYFTVGDYDQAHRYISSYLTAKPKSAEGYHLLGKSLEKLGKLNAALEAYRHSLQIDPKQNNLVIKVCELLSSDNVELDLSGARYFCDLAQSFDPNNQVVNNLKERLIVSGNENPQEVSQLLLDELENRPADVNLRIRLVKHFLQNNMIKEAYKHTSIIEEKDIPAFNNSIRWYETIVEVLQMFEKDASLSSSLTWEFWMLSVSVLERLVALSLDDRQVMNCSTDCLTVLFNFDQMLHKASKNISNCTDHQLVSTFLSQYNAQLEFHFSTTILMQSKKDIVPFKEASNVVLPTLLTAYHTTPPDLQSVWYSQCSDKTKKSIQRWHRTACFRCSQSGHVLLDIVKDKKSTLLEKAAQYSSGMWREQFFKKIFVQRPRQLKISTSSFVGNDSLSEPTLKLPDPRDLLKYDQVAQLYIPDSINHYIWIFTNSNMSEVNITTFEGMQYSTRNLTNCSAESLNLLDIYSFVYCSALCAKFKFNDNKLTYYHLLPLAINNNTLGTIQQSQFIQCAYKMYKNEPSSNFGDIRAILIKGIEVVRCIGHHGLDPKILVNVANILDERSKRLSRQSEIDFTVARAELYWKTALPLLEKIKNNQKIVYNNNRLFDFVSKELTISEATSFIEKGKLFVGTQLMKKSDFDRALEIFEQLKDPYASYHQFEIYKQFAQQNVRENGSGESGNESKIFLTKARDCLYLTLDRLKEPNVDTSHPLNFKLGTEIEKIERILSDEVSSPNHNVHEGNRSLDISLGDHYLSSLSHVSHNLYGTKLGAVNQSTPVRHNVVRQEARPSPERLDAQIRQLMSSRDTVFSLLSEQNRYIVDAQKVLLDKINGVVEELKVIKRDVEVLKDIPKSVEEVKNSVEDLHNLVDVVQELKKEIAELKKSDTKNQLSDEDLYVLDPDYGVDYNVASNVGSFPPTAPGMYPNYAAGRFPIPNHLAAYAPQLLYPGLYPSLPYPYGGLNLTQPGTLPFLTDPQTANLAAAQPSLPQPLGLDALSGQTLSHIPPASSLLKEPTTTTNPLKLSSAITPLVPQFGKSAAPVNVVITTSDPLPAENTSTSQPVLSVIIPQRHIKGNIVKADTTPNPVTPKIAVVSDKGKSKDNNDTLNDSNASDNSPEEHEPKVDFKPVIPLPDEVPVTTGEEHETELFCGRAKLFRHVTVNGVKEWKERGVGNIKILKNKSTDRIRILMRRDQVLKICANHFLTSSMNLMPMSNNDKAYMWAAQDYSDGELTNETFCIRFKTSEDAKKFQQAFESSKANSNVKKDTKTEESIKKDATPKTPQFGTSLGGFAFTGTPVFVNTPPPVVEIKDTNKTSPFLAFSFGKTDPKTTFSPLVISKEIENDNRAPPSPAEEEFVPTAEFKPVVALPQLVEVKTGEETAQVLFEARAKLFRYDSSGETKEWKERGVGTIKILKDESIRLVMRRDQVHKVCCNHRVIKDMVFKPKSSNPKAIVWQAQDFSDGVLKTEMFTARFKNEDVADEFLKALRQAQDTLDANNLVETPKQNPTDTKFTFTLKAVAADATEATNGFGEAFKPKAGSWECNSCMIRNEEHATACVACGASRSGGTIAPVPLFNFGTDGKVSIQPSSDSTKGFGDKFKPKVGSWECKVCMVRNEAAHSTCQACDTPLSGDLKQTVPKGIDTSTQPKFSFGIPPGASVTKVTEEKPPMSVSTPIVPKQTVDNLEQKWAFGIMASTTHVSKNQDTVSTSLFGNNSFSFISPTKQEFQFTHKPSRRISQGNESDPDASYVEEEEDTTYFKPVIPLPNKIQVKTGEEEEDVLYSHRAKLFRFVDGEWKERGLGDIKILNNKTTGKLRVVMRREQVLKICLNHALTKNIQYIPKDEKSFMFAAADFSEGELVNEQLCVRFKNADIAKEFKNAIDSALEGISTEIKVNDNNDDVEIIFETRVTPEEEEQALRLGLPPKFMSYKQLPDCNCEQCKIDDEYLKDLFSTETVTNVGTKPVPFSFTSNTVISSTISDTTNEDSTKTVSPLLKPSVLASQTENSTALSTSTFSWPSTTSNIFSAGSNLFASNFFGNSPLSKTSLTTSPKPTETTIETTIFSPGSSNISIFSFDKGFSGTSNIFGQKTPSIFEQNSSTSHVFGQKMTSTSIFGQNTPTVTTSASIFGEIKPVTTIASIFVQNTPTTSIFGQSTPTTTTSTSIFGAPTTLTNVVEQTVAKDPLAITTSIFGSNLPIAGSIFGGKALNVGVPTADKEKTGFIFGNTLGGNPITTHPKETDEVVFKCDSNLSFATVAASSLPAFTKTADNFSFLDAGAPVFGSRKPKTDTNTTTTDSDNENNTSNLDEAYDPHYAPIVPLPDAIIVTTGEEDETILFKERSKLYRYDEDTKEWKERGVGNLKVLHHPIKNTYRLIMRRDQVFKVVLNQLISSSLDLQPMLSSNKAWVWAGYNYTDDGSTFEKLAVRFKNEEMANTFRDVINNAVVNVSQTSKDASSRVEDLSDADNTNGDDILNPLDNDDNEEYEYPVEEEEFEEEVEEEEDEKTIMFMKKCTLSELDPSDNSWSIIDDGFLQVCYDADLFAARIAFFNNDGLSLSNTLIAINTEIDIHENECTWRSVEWADGDPRWRNLKATFPDECIAEQFHCTYLEGVNYAQQIDLTDEIPHENDPED